MKIRSSCHTHTQFCDGRSTAEEMAASALLHDFYSLGFTSHALQLWEQDATLTRENEPLYRKEILRLKEKYKDKIKIVLGIERDLFSASQISDYEYFIASVHYIPYMEGFVAVDGSADQIAKYVKNHLKGQGILFAKKYFELLCAYARSFRPPIIGHFDLIRKNNARLHLYDENSTEYKDLVASAVDQIISSGAMLEVNTGGIARGYLPLPYPDDFALRCWQKAGGEVIVSSDCHDAENIACFFDQVPSLLRQCHFDHIVQLSPGKELFEKISL